MTDPGPFTDEDWHDCEACGQTMPYEVNVPCHGLLVCDGCACTCRECVETMAAR